MFRLGETLAIRVPKRPEAVPLLKKEARALPLLSQLPLAVPRLHRHWLPWLPEWALGRKDAEAVALT